MNLFTRTYVIRYLLFMVNLKAGTFFVYDILQTHVCTVSTKINNILLIQIKTCRKGLFFNQTCRHTNICLLLCYIQSISLNFLNISTQKLAPRGFTRLSLDPGAYRDKKLFILIPRI